MNIRIPLIPFASTLLALSLVTACSNDGHSSHDSTPQQQEHKLRKVGSAAELEAYLKDGLKMAANANGLIDTVYFPQTQPEDDVASGGNNGSPPLGTSFSNTTLIEAGVDEADIVKSDGDLVFVAVPASAVLFPVDESNESAGIAVGEPNPSGAQNHIRVMRADDATHSASEIAQIDIPHSAEHDYQSISGLILADENNAKELVAITSASSNVYQTNGAIVPDQWSSIWAWSYGSTIIDTFDVSDTAAIAHQHRIEIDGYLLQTRRIENTLYVVTRFTPEVAIADSTATRNAEIDALSLTQLLPQVSVDGDKSTLVSPDNCFVDGDASGYPTLMVVTAIDLGDNSLHSSCVTANMYGFYMSQKALYLTQAEWSESNNETTHIYKFSLSGNGPEYRGEGSAEGAPTANYNFSISEHDDVLRIATTNRDAALLPVNQLYTFSETTSGDLQKLATLPNERHPESIGKPGETIQGIRFVGDRAYVVTFLQQDPLYVIDLSDPADPFIAGQVEIPGFSTLLQPLGDDLLLGVGRENNSDLKVELYDVQNPSEPQSIGKYVMSGSAGSSSSYSAAAWDHHALALLPEEDSVRVAVPFYRYSYGAGYEETQGALSFSIDRSGRSLTAVAEADATSDEYIYGEPRILLLPHSLLYLQGSKIWGSLWGSSETMANPQ